MIGKVNDARKLTAVKNRKDNSDVVAKQQASRPASWRQKTVNKEEEQIQKKSKPVAPSDVLVIDNHGTTIEVTVKRKGHKSGSMMVSSGGSNVSKNPEDKKPISSSGDNCTRNWSKTLREQNRPILKQGFQQLDGQIASSKYTRHENLERKELQTHKSHKYGHYDNRLLDEIPVKQTARKSSEHSKANINSAVPSTTTIASSLESIEVHDRGVQCGGIFDYTTDTFAVYNPVRTLGILMKEMEGVIRDERSSKILNEMEQALLRIPAEMGKPTQAELEALAIRPKLEASMAQLEYTSRKLELASAKLREEKEALQQQVAKQAVLLEESQQRERNSEAAFRNMRIDMNDAMKSAAENRITLSTLREENKRLEASQKLAIGLRRELNEQIELAEQRYMEIQYLQLEKEKLAAVSSYKDSMLTELRKTLKDLQNHIADQLVDIREVGKRIKDTSSNNHQLSIIHGGLACSSLTSSSQNSLSPQSGPEISEISLSIVDGFSNSCGRLETGLEDGLARVSETKQGTDKTQLEFISLPGGETSHTISLSHRKDEESKLPSNSETQNNRRMSAERKLDERHSAPNLGSGESPGESHSAIKDKKANRSKSRSRKCVSSCYKKLRTDEDLRTSLGHGEDDRKTGIPENSSGDPASIKEQFEIMFEGIRLQTKFPIRVPSPPRNYPRPDWSDSSLPTMSGISESNLV